MAETHPKDSKDPKVIAVIGHGGCGKDTFADLLFSRGGYRTIGSISWFMKTFVANRLKISEQTAWETRRENREEWARLIDEYRKDDPARVIREMAHAGARVIPGVRRREEFEAAIEAGIIEYVVWVDRPVWINMTDIGPQLEQLPKDPTLQLHEEDADDIIDNTGTLMALSWMADGYIRRVLERS